MFIFAQFLEKIAQKQNVPKFLEKFTQFSKVAQYMQSSLRNFKWCSTASFHAVNWTNLLPNLSVWEKNFAQKMFIFAQFLEKFAQKQNVPKFLKNLPNFQKLPNTCSPAIDRSIVTTFHAEFFTGKHSRLLSSWINTIS